MSADPPLLGRERELAAVRELIAGGGALVVRGEPGIGKSALLLEGRRLAADLGVGVLTAVGVQSEADLPFAGLHQLLRPLLGDVGRLPRPKRDALLSAFGMADAAATELFLIALATMDLLAAHAERAPVLVVADDAQWLDRSTVEVFAFVARRLAPEPIAMLASSRTGPEDAFARAGLTELVLGPLDDAAAERLLSAGAGALPPAVRARLLDEAAGNPLALVELPLAWDRGQTAALRPPAWMPLTTRLEEAFASRADRMPPRTRALLLVAALNDGESVDEALGAGSLVTGQALTPLEVGPAIAAQLVDLDDGRLRFRHPLMRSAIQQGTEISQRHRAHAALASVLGGAPDRRAWHLAASIVGSDEAAASELDAAAERAQRRGAMIAATAALERAAHLSDDPAKRGGRLLRAAELAFQLGRSDDATRLLEQTAPLELGRLERARLLWLREKVEDLATGAMTIERCVALADQMRCDGDTDLALNCLMVAALKCWWSKPSQQQRDAVVAAAGRVPVRPDHPMLLTVLAQADPFRTAPEVLRRLARVAPDQDLDPEALRLLATAHHAVGAIAESAPFLEAAATALRSQGRLALLGESLVSQAWADIYLGRWSLAESAAREASLLARDTDQPAWGALALLAEATVAGLRGREARAQALAADADRALASTLGPVTVFVHIARGVAALGAGRFAEAFELFHAILDPATPAYHAAHGTWVVLDLAEAAVHGDRREQARAALVELARLEDTGSPLLRMGLQCARPLLAHDDEAEPLFQKALDADLTDWPFSRARVLLAYGSWLRRQRRVAESRAPLRAAAAVFQTLGAAPWTERAERELRASGEAPRRRSEVVRDRLTPQELQIARMAAEGLSNRVIGERLYLSHRTVGSHLYRLFPKLGIVSRSELRDALAGGSAGRSQLEGSNIG